MPSSPVLRVAAMFRMVTTATMLVGRCTASATAASIESADAPDRTIERVELVRRIGELESAVRDLGGPRVARRADDADRRRELVDAVLADADTRALRLDDDATGGHDGRFFVRSADEPFRLDVTAFTQVAWYASRRSGGVEAGVDPFRGSFEMRRVRVKFRGTVIDPRLQFHLGTSVNRNTGDVELSDAFVRVAASEELRVSVGNHKPFFLWEWGVSARRLLFADRSLVSKRFAPDRAPGLHAEWSPGGRDAPLEISASVADPRPDLDGTDHLVSARATWRLVGSERRLRDFVGRPGDEIAGQVGAGVLDRRVLDEDTRAFTVDGTVQGDGWFAGGATVFSRSEDVSGLDRSRRSPWAVMVHAGTFVAPRTLIALEVVHGDGDADEADLLTTTVGIVHEFASERLKWNLDVGYGWHPVGASWASSGAGWLPDAPGEDGQVIVRTQIQLGF